MWASWQLRALLKLAMRWLPLTLMANACHFFNRDALPFSSPGLTHSYHKELQPGVSRSQENQRLQRLTATCKSLRLVHRLLRMAAQMSHNYSPPHTPSDAAHKET